jgi:hypothetical protein
LQPADNYEPFTGCHCPRHRTRLEVHKRFARRALPPHVASGRVRGIAALEATANQDYMTVASRRLRALVIGSFPRGMAAGVVVRDLSSGRSAPFQGFRMIGSDK